MVHRIYVEKKPAFASEAASLLKEAKNILRIRGIENLRVINRYDAENISGEMFESVIDTVFSEPPVDNTFRELEAEPGDRVFAVEYLPGQFDARANSAAECIQLITREERPDIRTAKIYVLTGDIPDEDLKTFKDYIINPVEAREASLKSFDTLKTDYEIPASVEKLAGFNSLDEDGLKDFLSSHGLAMDLADLEFVQEYFRDEEKRDPTITEIRVIDTYWSDHCRHTTYNTTLDSVTLPDGVTENTYLDYLKTREELGRTKPVTLMDIGTLAAKYLRRNGQLEKLDESEEINACTVKIDVNVDGGTEKWLLLFKNETHNHPTEIEPFGGAATCIGGAIRDPLSGRGYVYAAMRLTGAADPLVPVSETMEGKLPQRKIVTTAADGYSSYGNQIGLATGIVDEIYHPGYAAKRMEIGAVIAAAPEENVRRERPAEGDVVILLGGRTGRDGIGGATGSSKKHTLESLETCGAEVQKGNAPEERKLQRLFRNPEASRMIKRCNDFGAGGVSVAIGELAPGLDVDLNKVTRKYEGLDGTELAISESQERMAVVVSPEDADRFKELARSENLEATAVASVTSEPYLTERWNGETVVHISRAFLDTDGVEKHTDAICERRKPYNREIPTDFADGMKKLAGDLNVCSKRGLGEQFDSTIGRGTVLMPYGGKYQKTPVQAMVNLISLEKGHTDTVSAMAWGYNPLIASQDPYSGAYLAVVESVSKLIASGASLSDTYLSFQEYFGRPGTVPERWGRPLAAMLGAFRAQKELGVAAIGGKDSMSGSFEDLDVPPTLVSFAVTTDKAENIISPEFKKAGDRLVFLAPEKDEEGLPEAASLKELYKRVNELIVGGKVRAAYTPCFGGIAEAVLKMAAGNGIGFRYADVSNELVFGYNYGGFLLETGPDDEITGAVTIGILEDSGCISKDGISITLDELLGIYEGKLEPIYRCNIETEENRIETFDFRGRADCIHAPGETSAPGALIPVFPGTNCEYDTAKQFRDAGAKAEIFIINNLTKESVSRSVEEFAKKIRESQIIMIPGGFSGADEPDGSGKFITSFFRNDAIKEAVYDLLDVRGGLMGGICNGFQALIKLGLVPYGKITEQTEGSPTLTFNEIRRHQSRLARTRISSVKSPWMKYCKPGEVYLIPVSHGEGRFIASDEEIIRLAKNGQIITQYADTEGRVSNAIQDNPNGSYFAIEGITSPDGRIIGKMGHSERIGDRVYGNLYKNVPGRQDMQLFRAAVEFFR